MAELLRGLLDLLLPRACARCGGASWETSLCPRCAKRLVRLPHAACPRCQGPVASAHDACPGCRVQGGPLAACLAEVAFSGDAAEWVRRFKYPRPGRAGLDARPAAVVGELAVHAARRLSPPVPALVVPVPLHPRRLRRRGFHPAGELARCVARALGARLDPTALVRVRDTSSQTGLDRRARERNVAGAFRMRRGLRTPACVCLVDDVVTTGSTLAAAARALRGARPRRLVAVCAARTPAPR